MQGSVDCFFVSSRRRHTRCSRDWSSDVCSSDPFKSDITRVATYQIASEGGTSPVVNLSKNIGLSKDLHGLSHASTKGNTGYEEWGKWDQFIAKQLAYFIKRLKETKEGDGCLLDRTLVFQGAATSKVHNNHNYPLILAGGSKMGHKVGQFVKYVEEKNTLANMYVRIANCMGTPIEKFGDSTGVQMSEMFRSEEHTSELQSRLHLVCRLLLEKKNKKKKIKN